MEKYLLDNFRDEISQIRLYFNHIEIVEDVAVLTFRKSKKNFKKKLNLLKDDVKQNRTNLKVFEYKSTIISLYGLLEKHMEIWIKEYLKCLPKIISNYNDHEQNLKDKHFENSIKLLDIIHKGNTSKYDYIGKENILNTLNETIKNPSFYEFNVEAFTLLSGNLRHEKIVELFKQVLVDINKGLMKNEDHIAFLENKLSITNIPNQKTAILYNFVDDLVKRRNIIAHGFDVDDILDLKTLKEYLEFVEQYCIDIFLVLNEDILHKEAKFLCKQIDVSKIHGVYNNSILAFSIENYKLKIGDFIIVVSDTQKVYKKEILSIQINKKDYPSIEIIEEEEIGIRVKPPIRENNTFYLFKK